MISDKQVSQSTLQILTSEQQQGFDYAALSAATRVIIQQHTDEIKSLMRRTAQDVINIGQKLILVKEELRHGELRGWLKAEFGWSLRTAARFMQVATQFKSANLADLNIAASALYLLAESSTPEGAQEEALDLANRGEHVSYSMVKDIIGKHKEAAAMNISSEAENIIIPVEPVEIEEIQIASVLEISEDNQPREIAEVPEHLQFNNRYNRSTLTAERNNYPAHRQSKDVQSFLKVGYQICLTDISQQDYRYLGEVTEVKESTDTEFEVLIKVILQPN
jgi:Protein of unknown function (DUF3102)